MTLTASEVSGSVSTTNNTSQLKVKLTITTGGSWNNNGDTTGYVTINGTKHSLDGKKFGANTTTTLYEGTTTITHNSDGSKKVTVSYSFNTKTTLGTYTGSKDVTLTTIPRATEISCGGGTIGNKTTITLTRKSTAFYHKLYYKMSGQSSKTLIASGIAASSYSWTIPTSLYSLIPSATKLTGTLYCYTYSNSACTNQVGEGKTCSVTVNTSESACKPTVSLTLKTYEDTQKYTGSTTKVIKSYSTVRAISTVTAKNSAKISSYKVTSGGVTKSNIASVDFSKVTSDSFTLTATDSRGYSNSVTKSLTMINYINPDIAFAKQPSIDTDGKLEIKIKGSAFNGSFGPDYPNNIVCKYYYKESTASKYNPGETFTLVKSGNTYTANTTIPNLSYDKAYNVYCTIADTLHYEIPTNTVTVSGLPVFDWGESDFNFNVPVTISQEDFSGVRVYRKKIGYSPSIRFDNQDTTGKRQTLGYLAHESTPNGALYRYNATNDDKYRILDSGYIKPTTVSVSQKNSYTKSLSSNVKSYDFMGLCVGRIYCETNQSLTAGTDYVIATLGGAKPSAVCACAVRCIKTIDAWIASDGNVHVRPHEAIGSEYSIYLSCTWFV